MDNFVLSCLFSRFLSLLSSEEAVVWKICDGGLLVLSDLWRPSTFRYFLLLHEPESYVFPVLLSSLWALFFSEPLKLQGSEPVVCLLSVDSDRFWLWHFLSLCLYLCLSDSIWRVDESPLEELLEWLWEDVFVFKAVVSTLDLLGGLVELSHSFLEGWEGSCKGQSFLGDEVCKCGRGGGGTGLKAGGGGVLVFKLPVKDWLDRFWSRRLLMWNWWWQRPFSDLLKTMF